MSGVVPRRVAWWRCAPWSASTRIVRMSPARAACQSAVTPSIACGSTENPVMMPPPSACVSPAFTFAPAARSAASRSRASSLPVPVTSASGPPRPSQFSVETSACSAVCPSLSAFGSAPCSSRYWGDLVMGVPDGQDQGRRPSTRTVVPVIVIGGRCPRHSAHGRESLVGAGARSDQQPDRFEVAGPDREQQRREADDGAGMHVAPAREQKPDQGRMHLRRGRHQ